MSAKKASGIGHRASARSKLVWRNTHHSSTFLSHDGVYLFLDVTLIGPTGRWLVLAAQTPMTSTTVHAVLDNHAHDVVGERFKTRESAQRAAEAYARKWLRGRQKSADKCDCSTIQVHT